MLPYICTHPCFCTPPYVHTVPRGVHTPILDPSFTPPVWGCLPLGLHPQPFIGLPVHWYVLGIYVCDMGNISLMLGVCGCSPICWGFWGISTWVSICLFLYILVVHYVSHFYFGYDYYSSSYGGVFWAVICFISDCGSLPDGASCNIGSVWSGSTTTIDAERLWRCYCPCLCATAATCIFDAPSGLCLLCYGFSTGRFLFQS